MKEQKQNRSVQAAFYVDKMRRLYSQIGEPLPVDVIIDLHRHLGGALEIGAETARPEHKKTGRKIQA